MAIVAAVSLACGKPFVIVRKGQKGYGTDKAMEGKAEPGQRVVMVEDVVTSGGAALMAADKLREAGLEVDDAALRRRPRRRRPRADRGQGSHLRPAVHGHLAGDQEAERSAATSRGRRQTFALHDHARRVRRVRSSGPCTLSPACDALLEVGDDLVRDLLAGSQHRDARRVGRDHLGADEAGAAAPGAAPRRARRTRRAGS